MDIERLKLRIVEMFLENVIDARVAKTVIMVLNMARDKNPERFKNHLFTVECSSSKSDEIGNGLEISGNGFMFVCDDNLRGNICNLKRYDLFYRFPFDFEQASFDLAQVF